MRAVSSDLCGRVLLLLARESGDGGASSSSSRRFAAGVCSLSLWVRGPAAAGSDRGCRWSPDQHHGFRGSTRRQAGECRLLMMMMMMMVPLLPWLLLTSEGCGWRLSTTVS